MKKGSGKVKENTALISFKISHDLYRELQQYSKGELDEAGLPLSPAQAARRLMLEALKKKR